MGGGEGEEEAAYTRQTTQTNTNPAPRMPRLQGMCGEGRGRGCDDPETHNSTRSEHADLF